MNRPILLLRKAGAAQPVRRRKLVDLRDPNHVRSLNYYAEPQVGRNLQLHPGRFGRSRPALDQTVPDPMDGRISRQIVDRLSAKDDATQGLVNPPDVHQVAGLGIDWPSKSAPHNHKRRNRHRRRPTRPRVRAQRRMRCLHRAHQTQADFTRDLQHSVILGRPIRSATNRSLRPVSSPVGNRKPGTLGARKEVVFQPRSYNVP